jgi:hypothetical protein
MSGGQLDRTAFAVTLPHALRILLALLECAGAVAFVRPAARFGVGGIGILGGAHACL